MKYRKYNSVDIWKNVDIQWSKFEFEILYFSTIKMR
jgi:hypothetical protein